MKRIVLLLTITFLMQSCLLINKGGKDTLVLVDAPSNVKVSVNNKNLEVKNVYAFSEKNGNIEMNYHYTGVKFKLKKNSKLQISSNDIVKTTTIKHRTAIGILIFESILTVGIGTIVDLATGCHRQPKERYIDVPAYLSGNKARSQNELMGVIREQVVRSNR
jgi:hypothetical protein